MHPSPAALADMTTRDLQTYRREVQRLMVERGDDNGAYGERVAAIDAILTKRDEESAKRVADFVNNFGR